MRLGIYIRCLTFLSSRLMMMSPPWHFVLLMFVLAPVNVSGALPSATSPGVQGLHGVDKFFCRGAIVIPGETREEVEEKCGEPAWVYVGTGNEREPFGPSREEWIYDFGHDQLLGFLRFRNGRLVTIRTATHGFGGARDGDCGYGANLSLGDSKLEVVAKCGEPTGGVADGKPATLAEDVREMRRQLLGTDQWTYNFGPDHPVHYLIFRHGRLMEIRSGGVGW